MGPTTTICCDQYSSYYSQLKRGFIYGLLGVYFGVISEFICCSFSVCLGAPRVYLIIRGLFRAYLGLGVLCWGLYMIL